MPLATTCPHCKTSFAVTPEQLERGRGEVRCGACKQVFAGGDYLRYLAEPDTAAAMRGGDARHSPGADPQRERIGSQPPALGGQPGGPGPRAGDGAAGDGAGAAEDAQPAAAIGARPSSSGSREGLAPPAQRSGSGRGDDRQPVTGRQAAAPGPPPAGTPLFPAPRPGEWDPLAAMSQPVGSADDRRRTRSDEDAVTARGPSFGEAAGADPAGRSHQPGDAHGAGDPARASPDRVKASQAIFTQAPARWRESAAAPEPDGHTGSAATPWYGLALIALLLLAALLLMLLFRSEIANQFPAARPVVSAVADAFGLPVGGVRSLGSLSIESTELQRSGSNGPASLHALLRNKDSRTIAWPALELTLSDQAGTVVLRKVILPADYLPSGAPPDGLRGRSEQPLRIGMDAGALPLANYSVTLFYP